MATTKKNTRNGNNGNARKAGPPKGYERVQPDIAGFIRAGEGVTVEAELQSVRRRRTRYGVQTEYLIRTVQPIEVSKSGGVTETADVGALVVLTEKFGLRDLRAYKPGTSFWAQCSEGLTKDGVMRWEWELYVEPGSEKVSKVHKPPLLGGDSWSIDENADDGDSDVADGAPIS